MMDTYLVEFYTKDGRKVGVQVSAYTAGDARKYAEQMPNYNYMASYPERINVSY